MARKWNARSAVNGFLVGKINPGLTIRTCIPGPSFGTFAFASALQALSAVFTSNGITFRNSYNLELLHEIVHKLEK